MAIVAGDIAFLGVNATDPDEFAILALKSIAGGDSFFVTDGGYQGTTGSVSAVFRATEGFLQYTAPTGGIAAGSVLLFTGGSGTPANAAVALNGGGSAGSVTVLNNGAFTPNNTSFSLSTVGDQLTAYTVTGGTYLTGTPSLLAFIDFGNNPYGPGSTQASSIPTISGGQVLDLANLDNAIFTDAANAYSQGLTALSTASNFSARETTRYDLTTLTSATTTGLTVSPVSGREGNGGTLDFTFSITRGSNTNAFTVDVATADGTATAGSDYIANSTTLTFTAGGALSQNFVVKINGDTSIEADETFAVNLSNIVATLGGATVTSQGQGTITNDDSLVSMLSAGDVDRDSAVLLAKTTTTGIVTFQVATDPAFSNIVATRNSAPVTDPLVPAKVVLPDGALAAGTAYYWRATDALGATASASFRTADADGMRNGFSMGVTGDWRGELAPYPAIRNAATAGLDLFVKLGDTIYADYASPALNQPQAITLTDYLTKHNEVYSPKAGLDAWGDLQKTTAILSVIDDHEVINDFAGGAPAASDARFNTTTGLINDTPLYENGLTAFLAYNAIEDRTYANTGTAPRTDGERDLYRYSQQGRDAAVYVLDARSFRDAELAPASSLTDPTAITNFLIAAANPTRTMLGAAQLAQLKTDLLDAQAKGVIWKFIQIPEPIQNFGVLGAEDRFEGYAAERTEILKFIKDQGLTGVVFVSADIHGSVVNNLTYQEVPGGPQIAVAAWEITTGSVAFDAPFGQTVGALAGAAGLLTPQQTAFYNSLPVAPDTDSAPNDRDDFIKGVINQQVTALGYDPIGLNANLSQTNGLIDATLNQGDYLVTHGYGWTRFDVDATTGDLTVTTYAVPYYSVADAAANPAAIAALNPTVQAQFTVRATINETITGTAMGETLDGGGGNDTIAGLGGNDTITGGYGNDSIDGGAGNDLIDGGLGSDTAAFSGSQAAYRFGFRDAVVIVSGPDGTDQLSRVELLAFGAAAAVSIASLQGGAGDAGLVYASLGGRVGYVLPDAYAGPVAGLVNQLLGGAAGDVVLGTAQADFINGLGGDDAIDGGAGNDVIDGGLGSNFLTGGAGIDQFFVDGRGAATGNTWSTITDWQAGEALTLFGYQAGVSRFLWVANDGAAGYQGVTLHADLDGSGLIDTSVTWTGLTQGQLPVVQFGADYVFVG